VAIDGRGRKIDERKKKRVVPEKEREGAESQVQRERKIVKKIYLHATVFMQIYTGTEATCIYIQVYPN